jgi:hypothetical protein
MEDLVYSLTQCSSRQLPCSLLKSEGTSFHRKSATACSPLTLWSRLGRVGILVIWAGLAGRSFAKPEELLEGVRGFLEGIPAAELTAVFEGWIDRVRLVIAHNGQYYSS